jgi:hypothetical protein
VFDVADAESTNLAARTTITARRPVALANAKTSEPELPDLGK